MCKHRMNKCHLDFWTLDANAKHLGCTGLEIATGILDLQKKLLQYRQPSICLNTSMKRWIDQEIIVARSLANVQDISKCNHFATCNNYLQISNLIILLM